MYCSTCGASIPVGRAACDTCGAGVAVPARARAEEGVVGWAGTPPGHAPLLQTCPRCEYQGEGLPYFSRGSHAVALGAATLFTFPMAFGAGGFLYWGLRHNHRVCPRCGLGWGRFGERARFGATVTRRPLDLPQTPLANAESPRRIWSILLFVASVLMLIAGFVNLDVMAVLVGVGFGGGGFALHQSANRAREARRQALLAALQAQMLELARTKGGSLTVTDAALSLGWPIRRAEKVLHSLDDGLRVDSEVTDEGIIVYQFRELLLGRDGGAESASI